MARLVIGVSWKLQTTVQGLFLRSIYLVVFHLFSLWTNYTFCRVFCAFSTGSVKAASDFKIVKGYLCTNVYRKMLQFSEGATVAEW